MLPMWKTTMKLCDERFREQLTMPFWKRSLHRSELVLAAESGLEGGLCKDKAGAAEEVHSRIEVVARSVDT